ncbi:PIN domain-containing protein [Treponema sp.]|uniref:PIN domain-containing protein n=1 Tax=Treponema sp. TaxID=166 RepID=UPI0025DA5963|nr:PIN domain-containing protein [Treponema sp.]MCR5217489.1 PIN domain-containing protein [Treponema sp.]
MEIKYLLDTSILAEFSKKNPDPNVMAAFKKVKSKCAISVITWQELMTSVILEKDESRKRFLSECLQTLGLNFLVVPFERDEAALAADMTAHFADFSDAVPPQACQLFATALFNKYTVVTHNSVYLELFHNNPGIKIEDWFESKEK